MADSDLYTLARNFLDLAVMILGEDTPTRRYVSHAAPVWDCEQVTTHLGTITAGSSAQPGMGQPRAPVLPTVNVTFTIVRCWPPPAENGDPPDGDALDEHAHALSIDAWRLWNGLRAALRGDLPVILAGFPCKGAVLGDATPQTPSGGFAAWTIDVRAEAPGYTP